MAYNTLHFICRMMNVVSQEIWTKSFIHMRKCYKQSCKQFRTIGVYLLIFIYLFSFTSTQCFKSGTFCLLVVTFAFRLFTNVPDYACYCKHISTFVLTCKFTSHWCLDSPASLSYRSSIQRAFRQVCWDSSSSASSSSQNRASAIKVINWLQVFPQTSTVCNYCSTICNHQVAGLKCLHNSRHVYREFWY